MSDDPPPAAAPAEPSRKREYVATDLGDGTALLARTGVESASESPLCDWERAVLVLHKQLSALREENAKLRAALREACDALESSYDVVSYPGNGTSRQDVAAKAGRSLLGDKP